MCSLRASSFAILIGWIVGSLSTTSLHAQTKTNDWRQFRGSTRQGLSTERGLPETWSSNKNILWKADLPGAGASSPIVVGQKVFVTCYEGFGVPGKPGRMDQLKYHLLCLSTKDGSNLFDRTIEPELPEETNLREGHGYASSTPASEGDDKLIYTFFGKTGVSAFDRTYREKWHQNVGVGTHHWGSAASVVLTKELVIVNASVESGCLFGFDRKSGVRRWKIKGIEETWSTPLLVDVGEGRQELVMAIRGKVLGFDPSTGGELWSCRTEIEHDKAKSFLVPSLVAKDGIVYSVAGERSGGGLAVRTGGTGDVTRSHRLWTIRNGSNVSSPVLHDGHLYWIHEDLAIAYCADANTGEIVYEQRLKGVDQVYLSPVLAASPVLADGKLYYVTRSGLTLVLAAKPEFELLAVNDLRDRRGVNVFNASPAISGGRLFIRSDQKLYCIGNK